MVILKNYPWISELFCFKIIFSFHLSIITFYLFIGKSERQRDLHLTFRSLYAQNSWSWARNPQFHLHLPCETGTQVLEQLLAAFQGTHQQEADIGSWARTEPWQLSFLTGNVPMSAWYPTNFLKYFYSCLFNHSSLPLNSSPLNPMFQRPDLVNCRKAI